MMGVPGFGMMGYGLFGFLINLVVIGFVVYFAVKLALQAKDKN
ncbi:hypothetical protein [Bacillus sp. Bva_UNVM-123]